jgi:hypothetical protein
MLVAMTTALTAVLVLLTVTAILVRVAAAIVAIAHQDPKRRKDALATLRVLSRGQQ